MSKKILVVDDDMMNLRMAEFILQQYGYEVVKCESGMDCLNYLKEEKTDLILLDIEMPIMNGIQVLKEIRGNDDIADTPVMFLTASADADTVEDARKLGVVDYINKPFLPDELKSRVEKVFF